MKHSCFYYFARRFPSSEIRIECQSIVFGIVINMFDLFWKLAHTLRIQWEVNFCCTKETNWALCERSSSSVLLTSLLQSTLWSNHQKIKSKIYIIHGIKFGRGLHLCQILSNIIQLLWRDQVTKMKYFNLRTNKITMVYSSFL